MSRLKRLGRLEDPARLRKPERPFVDPYDAAMRLMVDLQAVATGKAEWRPVFGPPYWPEETVLAFERQMAEYESMNKRLATPV